MGRTRNEFEETAEELARLDPRGLIAEAYRLDAPSAAECRAIFLDWALGRTEAEGAADAVRRLHAIHAARAPAHPMTAVLLEGAGPDPSARPARRGGWVARRG